MLLRCAEDPGRVDSPTVSSGQRSGAGCDSPVNCTSALTFRDLIADAPGTSTVVARFLALLELFREHAIAFEQAAPLADLTVRWTGAEWDEADLSTDYDEEGANNE